MGCAEGNAPRAQKMGCAPEGRKMGDGNQAARKRRGRSRSCGTPQGAAPLARGASAVKWEMGTKPLGSGAKGAWEGGLIIRGPVLRGPRSPIPLLRERMPGRGRPADNRSRNCGTPQGAAQLAGGQVPSNGRWEPSRSEAAQKAPGKAA
jgi:hypothetical protein